MVSPPKNTCTPSNIYGKFNQTLFLGCSISSFSASAGYNEQQSEITVQLVEDTCIPDPSYPKKYYDADLTIQDWSAADPGFYGLTTPIIGAPVYFRFGDFEFSGLVQNWKEIYSESAFNVYEVKIVDPRQILENSQVIINEYAGGVSTLYNIINAFGFMETLGASCPQMYQSTPGLYVAGDGAPDGAVFGSPAGAYGGADVNDNGMQWNQILTAQRLLLSSFPAVTNAWSPYGRLVFKAPATIPAEGMGLMVADAGSLAGYYLDLEEVPTAPSYWRMNGVNISILEGISQICADSGHDYYIELVPVIDATLGAGVHKFIKIRTIDRASAPALNSIETFVADASKEVMSYSKGRELRNEITQAMVIGGPKNSFYQAEQSIDPEGDGQPAPPEADDMIIPFFGLNPNNGNAIIPYKDANGWWEFVAYTDDLALQLANPKYARGIAASVVINEKELLAAESGFDAWMSYAGQANTALWQTLNVNMRGIFDINHVIKMVKNLHLDRDRMRAADFVALRNNVFQPHNDPNKDFEIVEIGFAWLQKIVSEYYGKKFQVRVPYTCGRVDSESGTIQISEEPTDGGWTEVTPVLGLSHPSAITDFFSLSDNRLGAFCRFDNSNGLELSGLSFNDFISLTNKAWMKLGVDDEYVYVDRSTLFSPRAVVSVPQKISEINDKNPNVQMAWAGIVALLNKFGDGDPIPKADAEARLQQVQKQIGAMQTHMLAKNRAVMPNACGFGIKSNILSYGPWGAVGVAGGVNVIHEEGLVPWQYGGFTELNAAGNATATEGITNQQVTEEGQVTIAGYPNLPLGAELLAADTGGPFNGGGLNLVENRSASFSTISATDYYYVPIGAWNGTYGPNVTGLTTKIGPDGLETTYSMRLWTPKWGTFARGNAERIKQIGMNKLKEQKRLRAFAFNRLRKANLALLPNGNKQNGKQENRDGIKFDGVWNKIKAPIEMLMGQNISWNNATFTRPLAAGAAAVQTAVEMADEYATKAFMSLDGLIRPISMDGSGGLPSYAKAISACQTSSSQGAQPPTDKPGEAGSFNQYNFEIDIDNLNPFSNPSTKLRSTVVTDKSDTPNHGHDIEFVGRGTTPPNSSLGMVSEGYAQTEDTANSDHQDDYRMMALRGPLILKSWGYDLDGFPVPNKVDSATAAATGTFESTDLKNKFMDNWLRKSESWPTGPVDLRWDRARAVWTVPQYRRVVGQLKTSICPGESGTAVQVSGPTLYDTDGGTITGPEFIAHDEVQSNRLKSGDFIIAEYDPYDCKYRIIESRSQEVLVVDTNDCLSPAGGYPRPTIGEPLDFEYLNFGAGLWLHKPSSANGEDLGIIGTDLCDDARDVVHVMAGFRPYNNKTGCPTGTLTSDGTRFINVVDFQGGLIAVDGPNDCDLLLRAGVTMKNDNTCVETGSVADLANELTFGKGLQVMKTDAVGCKATASVYMDIGSYQGAAIELGTCLRSTPGTGNCAVKIDFAEKYGNGNGTVPIQSIAGISVSCCPTGGGILGITITPQTMNFNACGQLISTTLNTPVALDCTCVTESTFPTACPVDPSTISIPGSFSWNDGSDNTENFTLTWDSGLSVWKAIITMTPVDAVNGGTTTISTCIEAECIVNGSGVAQLAFTAYCDGVCETGDVVLINGSDTNTINFGAESTFVISRLGNFRCSDEDEAPWQTTLVLNPPSY